MNKIIITGACGQLGSFLIDFLSLDKTNNIIGLYKCSLPEFYNKNNNVKYILCDVTKKKILQEIIKKEKPDYFINLAALSSISQCTCFNKTIELNTLVIGNVLEAIVKYCPKCRFLNAGSEQEKHENNLYALSKTLAYKTILFYKKQYNTWATQPLIYPSISERQSKNSFCNKIIHGAVKIKQSINQNKSFEPIIVGNLDIQSDFTYSMDTAIMLWKTINLEKPLDIHIANGNVISNKEWVEKVFNYLQLNKQWESMITIDKKLCRIENNRICEPNSLIFTKNVLNFRPAYGILDIVKTMVDHASYE